MFDNHIIAGIVETCENYACRWEYQINFGQNQQLLFTNWSNMHADVYFKMYKGNIITFSRVNSFSPYDIADHVYTCIRNEQNPQIIFLKRILKQNQYITEAREACTIELHGLEMMHFFHKAFRKCFYQIIVYENLYGANLNAFCNHKFSEIKYTLDDQK